MCPCQIGLTAELWSFPINRVTKLFYQSGYFTDLGVELKHGPYKSPGDFFLRPSMLLPTEIFWQQQQNFNVYKMALLHIVPLSLVKLLHSNCSKCHCAPKGPEKLLVAGTAAAFSAPDKPLSISLSAASLCNNPFSEATDATTTGKSRKAAAKASAPHLSG